MSLKINGTLIPETTAGHVYFGGKDLTKVTCNGVVVWERDMSGTFRLNFPEMTTPETTIQSYATSSATLTVPNGYKITSAKVYFKKSGGQITSSDSDLVANCSITNMKSYGPGEQLISNAQFLANGSSLTSTGTASDGTGCTYTMTASAHMQSLNGGNPTQYTYTIS